MLLGQRNFYFDIAPFALSGTVYGTLLNHRSAVASLGEAAGAAPYNAPPRAPVLYVKPRNTLAANGDAVIIPDGIEELESAACLGLVIGKTACRVPRASALEHVAGYTLVNDVSVPHAMFYRPSIRYKARDGFCPLGPTVVRRSAIGNPDNLVLRTFVDGRLVLEANTADLVRPVAQLLAEVTEFMTLSPGDVLAVGAAATVPRVRAGQTVGITVEDVGTLSNPFVAAP